MQTGTERISGGKTLLQVQLISERLSNFNIQLENWNNLMQFRTPGWDGYLT